MSTDYTVAFLISLCASAVVLALDAGLRWGYGRFASGNPLYRRYRLAVVGVGWLVMNAAYLHYFSFGAGLFIVVSTLALAFVVHSELNQFWRVGLVGVDKQIRSGIDFRKALQLVSSSLDFLGIGAGKLTDERLLFEGAIRRCSRPDHPVRFLLCRPDNQQLELLAQSAGEERNSFRRKILDSLRVLADFRTNRAWNIQVRFYGEFPTFRLMFVDDAICLASHYVLGKGLGAESPQLHIIRLPGSRDVDSLYYAFNAYFEGFWKAAAGEEWDFQRYLDQQ